MRSDFEISSYVSGSMLARTPPLRPGSRRVILHFNARAIALRRSIGLRNIVVLSDVVGFSEKSPYCSNATDRLLPRRRTHLKDRGPSFNIKQT